MLKSAVSSSLIVIAAAAMPVLADGSSTMHHQGVVAVLGERFTGQGAFRFALVDPETNAYLWTNDGSTVAHPDPPTDSVTSPVVNGVYAVNLGDASITNMVVIPPAIFSQFADVALRVWFDDQEGNGIHRLSPDLIITSSPYAVQARTSEQLNIPGTDSAAVTVAGNGNVGVGTNDAPNPFTVMGDANFTGNVGIGTAAPSATLDVVGVTELNGDVSVNSNLTVDTDKLFVDGTNGSVGIGTTAPQAQLEIDGDIHGTAAISGFESATLFLNRDGAGFDAALRNLNGGAPFVFYGGVAMDSTVPPNPQDELMRLTTSGNLGIGTNAPDTALHVVGADNDGTTATLKIGTPGTAMLLDGNEIDVESDGNITINGNNAGNVILGSGGGNVGIGPVNPLKQLSVQGNVGISQNDDLNNSGLAIANSANTRGMLLWVGADTVSRIDSAADGSGLLALNTGGGNVGIGTISPSELLDVNGNANVDGDLDVSGLITSANQPFKMRRGVTILGATVMAANQFSTPAVINFGGEFSQPPVVTLTVQINTGAPGDASGGLVVHAQDVTATGCTVYARTHSAPALLQHVKVNWIAVGN